MAYRALLAELGNSDTAVINAQNYLVAQQQSNGSWGNNDPLPTSLILAALPASPLADTNNDGIPDALETAALLGANPNNTPTGRAFAKGNGLSVPGVTTTTKLAPARLDYQYSITLPTGSGTPPYTWLLTSGDLPAGLSLDVNTGAISGVPTVLGVFNFGYEGQAKDTQDSFIAQIEVIPSTTLVPALPDWARLLLALILVQIMRIAGKRRPSTYA